MSSNDSETLDIQDVPASKPTQSDTHPTSRGKNDFPSMGVDLLKRINFKVSFFLLLMGMFLFSDLFVDNVLTAKYKDIDTTNTAGTTVQLVVLVLAYIVIDLLVQGGIL
jgi:hypothetical protein